MTISGIHEGLAEQGYISTRQIDISVKGAMAGTPLLIEGDPGTGKTILAETVSKMLGLPLIRVQFYEGITADKILYDYDYQKQLLTIEAIKSSLEEGLKGKGIQQALDMTGQIDFYGKEFLIRRPILQSITGEKRCVLLLDEVDKSSEEIEYTLLEFLDTYSMSIPQYGTVRCPEDMRPIVFITSNDYRELSDAFRRRCLYLYIPPKTAEEMKTIIQTKAGADEKLAEGIARCIVDIRKLSLKQQPSAAEAVLWAKYLMDGENGGAEETAEMTIVKDQEDMEMLRRSGLVQRYVTFSAMNCRTW